MLQTKIIFINGKSDCGCTMEFSDGHGEYSDVHTITLCRDHDRFQRPRRMPPPTPEEALRRMKSRIDGTTKFGESFD